MQALQFVWSTFSMCVHAQIPILISVRWEDLQFNVPERRLSDLITVRAPAENNKPMRSSQLVSGHCD